MEKKIPVTYCNGCGKKIETEDNKNREDYLFVEKEWGYFSGKDGQVHSFCLCEVCYDKMIEKFLVPASVQEQTELL